MPTDYDLVILGGTLEGRMAATRAVGYGARVALVEVPELFERNQQQRYFLEGLQQLGRGLQQQGVGQLFGLGCAEGKADASGLNWAAVLEWSAIAAQTQCAHLSADVMSTRGVDVIFEVPERLSRKMVVTTANRRLRSRGVLAAYGLSPDVFDDLLNAQTLPNTVEIWGGGERSVQWAEALSTLGAQVLLKTTTVLPGWDDYIQRLVRSQLITKGIQFVDPDAPSSKPTQTDVTLKLGTEQSALTLPQWIQENPLEPSLTVNRKLQTRNPRVFACGGVLGGFSNAALAQYEAKIALDNALFLPKARADYAAIVHGTGQFAKVGCTETQARKQYGTDIQIWQAISANGTDLSRTVPQSSYCKLVCLCDRLVGAHLYGDLYGDSANDWATLLASAIGQPLTSLDKLVGNRADSHSLGGLIASAVGQAQQSRWQPGLWRRDWAENWFNWRRSR